MTDILQGIQTAIWIGSTSHAYLLSIALYCWSSECWKTRVDINVEYAVYVSIMHSVVFNTWECWKWGGRSLPGELDYNCIGGVCIFRWLTWLHWWRLCIFKWWTWLCNCIGGVCIFKLHLSHVNFDLWCVCIKYQRWQKFNFIRDKWNLKKLLYIFI